MGGQARQRGLGPAGFSTIVLAVALILFALPWVGPGQLRRLNDIRHDTAPIAIVGPSTIFHISPCDTDKRTVAAMVGDGTGEAVLDLSLGGQQTVEAVDLAAAALRNPAVTDVVLPLAHPYMDDRTTPRYRRFLLYKAMAPGFPGFAATSLEDFWTGMSGAPRRAEQGFTFEGRRYPDYRVLAATRFTREKALMRCPEPETHDPAFNRAYHWWTYMAARANPALYGLIARLRQDADARAKRLHVVMLPSNTEMLDRLQPGWGRIVAKRQQDAVAALARRGVPVLDLSRGFGNDEFSTRWCACVHLNEKGRHHLAGAIVADIRRGQGAAAGGGGPGSGGAR